jgi:hypothetical protein
VAPLQFTRAVRGQACIFIIVRYTNKNLELRSLFYLISCLSPMIINIDDY